MTVSNPFLVGKSAGFPVDVEACRLCPRLVAWREVQGARVPRRFSGWVARFGFWGRPVPAFGDPNAWLAIVGLAPAAQGANRTGRMFTGDRSGEFLFAGLHRAGLASAAASVHRGDGLSLGGVAITAAVRCAPPANRPTSGELEACRRYLIGDLAALARLRVVLALGRIAHDAVVRAVGDHIGWSGRPPRFSHGAVARIPGGLALVDSYHVSQQNTFTGRLTDAMFDVVLTRCKDVGLGGLT